MTLESFKGRGLRFQSQILVDIAKLRRVNLCSIQRLGGYGWFNKLYMKMKEQIYFTHSKDGDL